MANSNSIENTGIPIFESAAQIPIRQVIEKVQQYFTHDSTDSGTIRIVTDTGKIPENIMNGILSELSNTGIQTINFNFTALPDHIQEDLNENNGIFSNNTLIQEGFKTLLEHSKNTFSTQQPLKLLVYVPYSMLELSKIEDIDFNKNPDPKWKSNFKKGLSGQFFRPLIGTAQELGVKCIFLNQANFNTDENYGIHRVLRINNNTAQIEKIQN
ncbi:MAG: hypothetical protein OHK0017_07110 [Patescibacteria group bacterium]